MKEKDRKKGLLRLFILRTLSSKSKSGYDLLREIEEKTRGKWSPSKGTIYPILSRFRREGLVETSIQESREGPARKYYELTDRGRELLATMNDYWTAIKQGIDALKTENVYENRSRGGCAAPDEHGKEGERGISPADMLSEPEAARRSSPPAAAREGSHTRSEEPSS